MNKTEIQTFIEEMKSIGDIWTPEQVEKEYGDYSSGKRIWGLFIRRSLKR